MWDISEEFFCTIWKATKLENLRGDKKEDLEKEIEKLWKGRKRVNRDSERENLRGEKGRKTRIRVGY